MRTELSRLVTSTRWLSGWHFNDLQRDVQR
jgi:hypothetical protein